MCETVFIRSLFQLYFSTSFVSLQLLCMLSNVRLTSTLMKIGSSIYIPQNANWILMNVSYLIGFPETSGYLKTSSSNNLISVYCHYWWISLSLINTHTHFASPEILLLPLTREGPLAINTRWAGHYHSDGCRSFLGTSVQTSQATEPKLCQLINSFIDS